VKPQEAGSNPALPPSSGRRVGIVTAEFYPELAAWLEDGATRALDACGVEPAHRLRVRVPGCFELPLAARRIIEAERLDAAVALGVVIRGETPHFDYVAGGCTQGIMSVQLSTGVPIGFGILTTDTLAQAEQRADPRRGDKGFHATVAALTVAAIGIASPRPIGLRR
jgi:6,7-dimethyl-8-ribityllumazine synthase